MRMGGHETSHAESRVEKGSTHRDEGDVRDSENGTEKVVARQSFGTVGFGIPPASEPAKLISQPTGFALQSP